MLRNGFRLCLRIFARSELKASCQRPNVSAWDMLELHLVNQEKANGGMVLTV